MAIPFPTPHVQACRLEALSELVPEAKFQFGHGDVVVLALDGREVCCITADDEFDMWAKGRLAYPNLDLTQAAHALRHGAT